MTRRFNPQEDRLIIEQSEGLHSIVGLMRAMHTSREAISRRAGELGVEVNVRRRRRYSLRAERYARHDELLRRRIEQHDENARDYGLVSRGNPVTVEYRGHADALLETLLLFHGNRRY